jgi:hypothetical protein
MFMGKAFPSCAYIVPGISLIFMFAHVAVSIKHTFPRTTPPLRPAMLKALLLAAALAGARAQLPNKTVTYQLNQSTIIMCVTRAHARSCARHAAATPTVFRLPQQRLQAVQ